MMRPLTLGVLAVSVLVGACGGPQENSKSAEGPAEKAGKELDDAAGNVKETIEPVGEKVGNSIGEAGENVKGKLGGDEAKDAGAAEPAKK